MWDMRKDSWVLKEEYNNKQMVKVRVLTKAQLASEIHIFILGRKMSTPNINSIEDEDELHKLVRILCNLLFLFNSGEKVRYSL